MCRLAILCNVIIPPDLKLREIFANVSLAMGLVAEFLWPCYGHRSLFSRRRGVGSIILSSYLERQSQIFLTPLFRAFQDCNQCRCTQPYLALGRFQAGTGMDRSEFTPAGRKVGRDRSEPWPTLARRRKTSFGSTSPHRRARVEEACDRFVDTRFKEPAVRSVRVRRRQTTPPVHPPPVSKS